MNCQDVAKLRTPLDAVCQTTDIGCVPIVSGKPTCKPQPDELPIAYDKSTSTLWLFSCDTREWIAYKKFTMDELQDLNLENLNNICSILKIGVFYNPGTGTIQGNVSLDEFAEQLLKCLDLKTKVVTVTQGENNTIKISIEGLDGLPPTYIKGDNVWFTGTGTEGDPIIVHTYDPICKWPVASQSAVDAATTKHLGACLDGQPSRVPYPLKPCEYPQKTQEEVDAATSKNLIACVDGQPSRVPYPKYQPPVCEANQLTLEQAKAKGSALTFVGCDNGNTVRIPVSQSGFFDRDYICVPSVTSRPSGAPLTGTGPLRIGCNGELYVWLCDESRWVDVRFNPDVLNNLNPSVVSDLCNNFRMMGWYSNTGSDPCVQEVKFTLAQLRNMIESCSSYKQHVRYVSPTDAGGGMCFVISVDNGVPTGHGNDILFGYSLRDGQFVYGGTSSTDQMPKAHITLNITNPWPERALLEVEGVVAAFTGHRYGTNDEYQTTVYADFTRDFNSPAPWMSTGVNRDWTSIIIQPSPTAVEIQNGVNDLYTPGKSLGPIYKLILEGNESVTIYGFLWFLGVCVPPATIVMHARMHAGYTLHRYA